ncbi:hypothetical protein J0H58_18925 [bacterium]|nr:hypothetical protein [bacterium]
MREPGVLERRQEATGELGVVREARGVERRQPVQVVHGQLVRVGDGQERQSRHLERFQLGTGYPEIVAGVKGLFAAPPLAGSRPVVDATGVGRAVVDMLKGGGVAARVTPWTITAGHRMGNGTVPKKDLVGSVQAVLGTRRLKIAPGLPLAEVLAKELESFRVKVTADRNETFESWRERDHDDLVLALALAVWTGERLGPPLPTPPPRVLGGQVW